MNETFSWPHNAEAERSVLGTIIRQNPNIIPVIAEVGEEGFYLPANRDIFREMVNIFVETGGRDKAIEEVALVERLEKAGKLKASGGVTYLTGLRQFIPVLGNFRYYLDVVKDKAKRRRLIRAGQEIIRAALDADSSEEAAGMAGTLVFEAAESKASTVKYSGQAGEEALEDIKAELAGQGKKIKTGFLDIDEALGGGLGAGEVAIIAARTSLGKTTLALNMAANMAKAEYGVAFFSFEMTAKRLGKRLLASESGVALSGIKQTAKDDMGKLTEAVKSLDVMNIYIDENRRATTADILAGCRRRKLETGKLDVVFVDYLQKVYLPGDKHESRATEVAKISAELSAMAQELGVSFVILSQMNRDSEKGDKPSRPTIAQLRESGAIEQDADVIMMLHRDRMQGEGETEVIFGKNRDGRTGKIWLRFDGEVTRFENLYTATPFD